MSAQTKWTPGPWNVVTGLTDETAVASVWPVPSWKPLQVKAQCLVDSGAAEANARLIAAAPELFREAEVLRCLATSPRFQTMTVAEALAELAANGCGHDGGAALARARGETA